jgi:hypothetical protein
LNQFKFLTVCSSPWQPVQQLTATMANVPSFFSLSIRPPYDSLPHTARWAPFTVCSRASPPGSLHYRSPPAPSFSSFSRAQTGAHLSLSISVKPASTILCRSSSSRAPHRRLPYLNRFGRGATASPASDEGRLRALSFSLLVRRVDHLLLLLSDCRDSPQLLVEYLSNHN